MFFKSFFVFVFNTKHVHKQSRSDNDQTLNILRSPGNKIKLKKKIKPNNEIKPLRSPPGRSALNIYDSKK